MMHYFFLSEKRLLKRLFSKSAHTENNVRQYSGQFNYFPRSIQDKPNGKLRVWNSVQRLLASVTENGRRHGNITII